MKAYVLRCGAMTVDRGMLIDDPRDRAGATRCACPLHAVVIEHPEATFLWDTAAPRDWETRWAGTGFADHAPYDRVTEEEFLDSRLRQVGLETGDIDIVVLSHLHVDHAGNARLFDNGRTRILAHANEVEAAHSFAGPFQGGYLKADYEGLPIETFSGDIEILDGVRLLEAPGHTAGTVSLQLDLRQDGPLIFTSDALYLRRSLELRDPGGAVWDRRAWLGSVDKLVGIAARTGAQLVFGHDAAQLSALDTGPASFYS
jgi:glyoxylase-like metal-dependent hydrolase (beta-lactamase superfamily II)